jgi:hypothetical protein
MTPEQWARVKDLLDRSRKLEPAAYRAAVEAALAEWPEIWDEAVLLLLAATREDEGTTGKGEASEVAPAPPDPRTVRAFAAGDMCGSYRVIRPVGVGGMGEVYLAEDVRTELPGMPIRRVALKCLTGKWLERPDARYRLLVEFAAAAALESHSHIAAAHDALELRNGRLMVLVMEFVEGTPLSQMISSGPLPWRFAVELAAQVASGLEQAHLRNILHCDVKPANIMVTPQRQAKILDFGLSRAAHMPQEDSTRIGTLLYMPPERVLDNVMDGSGDVYSLGVSLYEMLTGRRPFPAVEQLALMSQVLDLMPAPPSAVAGDVPADVDAIVMRAIAKEPSRRFQTARELAAALRLTLDPPPAVFERVLRGVVAATTLLLLTAFLGAISSRAIDMGLGRTGGFVGDVRHSSLVWGAMNLAAPLLFTATLGVLAAAVAIVVRLALGAAPGLKRTIASAFDPPRRTSASESSSSQEAIGQSVLLAQGGLLVFFVWYFWPLVASIAHFGRPDAVASTLQALRPSNVDTHEAFRMYGTLMMLALVASWWGLQRRRGRSSMTIASVGGLLAIAIGLCIFFYPFQVLFHNTSERVVFRGENCYLVARNPQGQARLFCPRASASERLRTIGLADSNLVLTGIVESVFAELDRHEPITTGGEAAR